MVAFLGYAMWVTLKHCSSDEPPFTRSHRRAASITLSRSSPMKALSLLSTLQSADIVLPTTDGRAEILASAT